MSYSISIPVQPQEKGQSEIEIQDYPTLVHFGITGGREKHVPHPTS